MFNVLTASDDLDVMATNIQGVTTDTATFVKAIELIYGHQSGHTIAHSKADNVEFLFIII